MDVVVIHRCLCCCSATVGPRRPGAKDPDMDYEVDSEEEWEAEPEDGEQLSVRARFPRLGCCGKALADWPAPGPHGPRTGWLHLAACVWQEWSVPAWHIADWLTWFPRNAGRRRDVAGRGGRRL